MAITRRPLAVKVQSKGADPLPQSPYRLIPMAALPAVPCAPLSLPDVSAPLFAVYVWRGIASGWIRCTYAPRSQSDAARLASLMRRAFPHLTYRVALA